MTYHYSPHTGEYIATTTPAAWMGQTSTPPPAFDSAAAGCFWRGTAWELVQAVPAAAFSLPPPKQFTSLEYLDLFSEAEQLAVVSATMAVPQVKLWYDKMLAAGFITSADPRTEGGLSALVSAGLLTEARKVEILAVMA